MKFWGLAKAAIFFSLFIGCSPLSGGGGGGGNAVKISDPTPGAAVDPTIVGVFPALGSSDTPTTVTLAIAFDVEIDESSLNFTTIKMYNTVNGPGATVGGVTSYDPFTRSVVFAPISPIEQLTNYTVEVANTIKSASGGSLLVPFSWNFTTRDESPPVILGSIPANFAINVDPNVPIVVQFNEPLNPESLVVKTSGAISGPIQFYQTSPNYLPGTVNYTQGSNEFSFVPGVQLLPLTNYTLRITGGIEDVWGNAMGTQTNYMASFTIKNYLIANLSSPFDGASNVPIDSAITVAFNNAINTSTVTTSTFTVSGGVMTALPLSFSGGDKFVTLIPSANLAPFTTYAVTLDGSIADTTGNALGTPKTFSFTTGSDVTSWDVATAVETGLNQADSASYQTVQAPNGDTFAIWIKNAIVWSSRMPAGGTWSAPTQISNPADGPIVMTPSIATDGNGNAMAVWIGGTSTSGSSNLTNTRVFALKYLAATGWSPITSRSTLSSTSFAAIGPTRIAMNSRGHAFAVWKRYLPSAAPGSQYQLYAKTFFPSTSFANGNWASGNEQKAQGNQNNDVDNLQIGVDGNQNSANGIAMWTQSSTVSGQHLFANRATSGNWNATTQFPNLDSGSNDIAPDSISLKVDTGGNAIAAWSQGAPGARSVFSRRFGGSTWSAIVPLENQANDAQFPNVALTESSPADALVVWQQADGGGSANNIYYNKYSAASNAWLASGIRISTHNPAEAAQPNVVMLDAIGNAMAIWREKTGASSIWQIYASKYTALNNTWGTSINLCSDTANDADLSSNAAPQIAGRANRNPVAFWSQKAGSTYSFWANVFR